jgi:hypothetical protein
MKHQGAHKDPHKFEIEIEIEFDIKSVHVGHTRGLSGLEDGLMTEV